MLLCFLSLVWLLPHSLGSPHLVAQHIFLYRIHFLMQPQMDLELHQEGNPSLARRTGLKSNNINMTIIVCALTILLLGVKL